MNTDCCSTACCQHADIIVLGGGTAGSVAAIAAARKGAQVLIVEREASLGGSATGAQVMPLMTNHINGNPDNSGISAEIQRRLIAEGYCDTWGINNGFFNVEMLKFTLEEMAVEAGVGLLYNTEFISAEAENGAVTSILVHNRDGLVRFTAKTFIDATGDALLAKAIGVACEEGHNGKNQHMSLRFLMGGIDEQGAYEALNALGQWCEKPQRLYFASLWRYKDNQLTELFRRAVDEGVIEYADAVYIQAFSVAGMPGVMAFNCPEAYQLHAANDAACVTQVAVRCRAAAKRLLAFFRKYLKGFENAYIAATASMPGIRESRRIVGRYYVTVEDYNNRAKFEDAIAQSAYPIDVHGGELDGFAKPMQEGEFMEVPYRCLLPKEADNLLVVGRCASADFLAQSALRIQLVCRAMGEAAGIAAARALQQDIPVCAVNGADIRKEMVANGGLFVAAD